MRQSGIDPPLPHFWEDVSLQACRPSYARSVKHHSLVLPRVGQGYIMPLELT
jgi:hypothetical protein